MEKINILAVDDELMFTQGLCSLLKKEPFVNATFEAHDETSFLHQLNNHRIDMILLDIRLKRTSGLELFKRLGSLDKRPFVIALTHLDGVATTITLLKLGFDAIVYKSTSYEEMVEVINHVLHSGSHFTPQVRKIIREYRHEWEQFPYVEFTFKEKEVVKGIADGIKTAEIAAMIRMTPGATEKFKLKLMKKAGVRNATELVSYAYQNGIL